MDFVSFEIAKKLKDKGFDYPCTGHYIDNHLYIAHYHNAFHSDIDESLDAPTISQVLKWLREEKKIHINIGIYPNGWNFYCCSCEKHNNGKFGDYDIYEPLGLYNSYEAAAIAGIEYCLENLI